MKNDSDKQLAMDLVGMPLNDALAYLHHNGFEKSQPLMRPPYPPMRILIYPGDKPSNHHTYNVIRKDGVYEACECNSMIQGCMHLEVNGNHVVAAFPFCQGMPWAWEEGRNITGPNDTK